MKIRITTFVSGDDKTFEEATGLSHLDKDIQKAVNKAIEGFTEDRDDDEVTEVITKVAIHKFVNGGWIN